MTNQRQKGFAYEEAAAQYLVSKGYKIRTRNFYTRAGELDIIAEDPYGAIIFVEVKYRSTTAYGDPAEAVNPRKQQRMARAATVYLIKQKLPTDLSCRFDVIAIYGDGTIRQIENAFEVNRW